MKHIATIRNQDVIPDAPIADPSTYRYREAVRAVVFKESQVALLYVAVDDSYKLPGGGVEPGETYPQALRREVLEEIGYEINNIRALGETLEYKDSEQERQRSFCFTATVVGIPNAPQLTDEEKALGFKTVWAASLAGAILLMENAHPENLYARFIRHRDLLILKAALAKSYA
jgi:8-oxo-dGTP diphosphatase